MGPLKNVRHEAFARALVEGKAAYQAYFDAGYECTQRAAETSSSDLLSKPEILARVMELAGHAGNKVAKRVALTKEWVLGQMQDAVSEAAADKQHSARIRAIELLGRETGNFTEQKRIAIKSFDDMSKEEIEAFLAGSPAEAPKKAISRGGPTRTSKKTK